jgi:hypothetical protein
LPFDVPGASFILGLFRRQLNISQLDNDLQSPFGITSFQIELGWFRKGRERTTGLRQDNPTSFPAPFHSSAPVVVLTLAGFLLWTVGLRTILRIRIIFTCVLDALSMMKLGIGKGSKT